MPSKEEHFKIEDVKENTAINRNAITLDTSEEWFMQLSDRSKKSVALEQVYFEGKHKNVNLFHVFCSYSINHRLFDHIQRLFEQYLQFHAYL